MTKQTISVVLATYNEEKNLPLCLDSVKDWANEIIVVDGMSEDKTIDIAKKYNAKTKIVPNKKNFHINKQIAIDEATCDWVLQLDADEQVNNALKNEIDENINNPDLEINGYWIPRKNFFLGRFLIKGGQYPDYMLRLYRRGKGGLPQKDVHEQAIVEGGVGYLKNPLLHYPYKSFSSYLQKWERYNNFYANQIHEEMRKKIFVLKILSIPDFLIIKPVYWFLLTYGRHKGFMDFWQGFVFSFFSSLRYPVSYIISLNKEQK